MTNDSAAHDPADSEPAGSEAARTPFDWLESTPFYQAGLQGYSDASMRIVARRHGAPYCVTEALLDSFLLRGGKGLEEARLDPEDHPIAGQLMGSHPEDIAAGAKVLVELGYDVVDVNIACPVRKMRKNCRGGHLLAEPAEATAILRAVRDAVGDVVPVTVKLRRGTDDSDEAAANFYSIIEAAIELGYSSATVHGRTVVQKYIGPSRWSFLRDLTTRYPEFRILGSGDIFTAEDVFAMIRETGVRGVSIARGAIGNPWIFRDAHALLRGEEPRAPTVAEQRAALETHCELAMRFLGIVQGGRRMRKFGIKFSHHHPEADEVAKAFIATKTPDDWQEVIKEFYSAERPVLAKEESAK
ncbi:MAG: tRNA-dihydrouridine synthase family protein [Planctomycetota bacterium]